MPGCIRCVRSNSTSSDSSIDMSQETTHRPPRRRQVSDGHHPVRSASAGRTTSAPTGSRLQRALDAINDFGSSGGRPCTLADIAAHDFPVPPRIYRSAPATQEELEQHGVRRVGSNGVAPDPDEYLAAIIKHTARTGGSAGTVMSISANAGVARRFLRPNCTMVEVDTTQDHAGFRTAADILRRDAERLCEARLITAGTVRMAIAQLMDEGEHEVFYVRGDVPPAMVVATTPAHGARHVAR